MKKKISAIVAFIEVKLQCEQTYFQLKLFHSIFNYYFFFLHFSTYINQVFDFIVYLVLIWDYCFKKFFKKQKFEFNLKCNKNSLR